MRIIAIGCKHSGMKSGVNSQLKTEEIEGPVERGYAEWKREKIERGLAQARDRDTMIPAEKILADLKLER